MEHAVSFASFASLPLDLLQQEILFNSERLAPHYLFILRRVNSFFRNLIPAAQIEENPIQGFIRDKALKIVRWDQAGPSPCSVDQRYLSFLLELFL